MQRRVQGRVQNHIQGRLPQGAIYVTGALRIMQIVQCAGEGGLNEQPNGK